MRTRCGDLKPLEWLFVGLFIIKFDEEALVVLSIASTGRDNTRDTAGSASLLVPLVPLRGVVHQRELQRDSPKMRRNEERLAELKHCLHELHPEPSNYMEKA